MKVFAYARVSTTGQMQDGVSQKMQVDRIAAWCVANAHELRATYVETGSGGRADNRPELQKCMAAVCKEGGIICCYSLSRLSRSVRDTLALTEKLDKAGAHLASLSESLDTSTATGRLIFRLLSSLSEFERDALAEKTRDALGHMRRNNRRISAKIPFGYTLADDGTTLLPNAGEQEAIARMMKRRASGMTLAAIAKTLETEIATREGGRWLPKTVSNIINRQQKLAA